MYDIYFLLINHYRQTKTGCAIQCFKILRTLRITQKKFASKGGRKGNATLKFQIGIPTFR